MKKLILFCCLFAPLSTWCQERDSLRNMLIITCHPDDWELSMAGTTSLLIELDVHYWIYNLRL